MTEASHLSIVSTLPSINSDARLSPRVPEGEYCLKLQSYSTVMSFGEARLVLQFSIVDMGENHGTVLYKYYNLKKLKGKPSRSGKFIPKERGDFMIEYLTLFPLQKITRLDRIPMESMLNSIIIGKVKDVIKNSSHKKLPEQLIYSKVSELLGLDR